ncbi:TRAP transporter substrate-binding protein [Azohydromonas lata]|uniref:TRAP transporter substrate-binding protein n=1 Tax=Azohydromonas lata TaxID=45677 RepID=A0ABU5IR93_9BURK|nr:TRAP transporter substrate-binding protein [Azohydromonas lata]MDZ5461420.1 TRAP transporter substrate-binding protein [Azohydromonas lata]
MNTLRKALLAALVGAALLPMANAQAADIKERTLKFASAQAADHPFSLGGQRFAELVTAKSGGKMKAKLFTGGTLGGDAQVISSLQGGTVDVTFVSPGLLSTMDKDFGIFYVPMAFNDAREADQLVDGPFGRKLLDKLPAKGLVGLAYWENGFRSITNSKRPIHKWEDLQGLKMRSIQIPIFLDIYKAVDANPVPLAFTELYAALESKAVDGQDNPLPTIETGRFYEVQKYLSLTRIVYDPLVVLFSKKTWDKLGADEQKLLAEAAREATAYQRQVNREAEASMVKSVTAKGMVVNELSAAERDRLRDKLKPVGDAFVKGLDPAVVAEFNAELAKARGASKTAAK